MSQNNASAPRKPVPKETQRNQLLAADPTVSAWVSANAGTGKTHVLSRRVLRLLLAGRDPQGRLAGTPPERILCLTFTKAAAAEMSQRVFKDLGDWAILGASELEKRLTDLLGRAPDQDERLLARRLFARAIETPGGLKVQTIHSFSEKLLQRFPLEAGIAPNFTVLDEATARELLRNAIDGTLRAATSEPASSLGRALDLTVTHAVEDSFEQALKGVLDLAAKHGVDLGIDDGEVCDRELTMAVLDRDLRGVFKVRSGISADDISNEMGATFAADVLPALVDALRGGSVNDLKQADRLALAVGAGTPSRRTDYLEDFFLTAKGEPRASLMTAKVSKARPDLQAMMQRAQAAFVALFAEQQGLTVVEASLAIVRIAGDVLARYEAEKAHRAALDYADLIAKSARLLSRSDQAQWVLYKLDGGLDHILVDEAQDTSQQQWDIVRALAEEFHAGDSARDAERDGPRTVFAVGDEKQSIYRFQGAAPKLFADMGTLFAERAAAAGRTLHRLPLNLSFRTVAPVLKAVDDVFGGAERPAGVTRDPTTPINHLVYRAGEPGLVELWDTEAFEATEGTDPWSMDEEGATIAPSIRLADRIAKTIRGWLDAKEILPSAGRPIVESDILILVRKRTPFAAPMIRALKAERIAVAGADRIRIAEELAVMDLLALADVLLLPEDDLALATVLKSPICGLSEDDLFELAASRSGSLWQALLKTEKAGRHTAVVEELKRWRSLCDYSPPYEFFASLLDHSPPDAHQNRGTVRARLLHRLGPEAADAIDEVLNLALRYDEQEAPSLQGFSSWMRSGGAEIKRDMDQGRPEVRVMTVHGAKGLEAPIVFLADTCSARSGGFGSRLVALAGAAKGGEAKGQARIVWPIKGTSGLAPVKDAKAIEDEEDRHEYHRLLYVAMTRARDRLYVCGFEGKRGREAGCWYDLIERGLAGSGLVERKDAQGRRMRRTAIEGAASVVPVPAEAGRGQGDVVLPPWITTKAPKVSERAIPLRPSRLAPLSMEADDDDDGDAIAEPQPPATPPQPILRPAVLASGNRFLRGELTHALLEHLPGIAEAQRRIVAEEFLNKRGADLALAVRRHIVAETLAVLDAPEFGTLFGPKARAEVAIAAEIAPVKRAGKGDGPPVRITGQIDRLVDLGHEILIVDYKTNRPPPHEPEHVADAYLLQLAAYRLALQGLWPGKRIRCALLWTDGPRIMEIPQYLLDRSETALWDLGANPLKPVEKSSTSKVARTKP